MTAQTLKRFTSFEYGVGLGYLEVWVNPAQVAYVQPRRRYDSQTDRHSLDGTLLYFQQEAGVLAVRDEIGYVVAALQSGRGGVCRDCYQILDEAWASLCTDCCRNHHAGVHRDPDEARAQLAADDAAAEAGYQDMLAHPESVVDAQELLS